MPFGVVPLIVTEPLTASQYECEHFDALGRPGDETRLTSIDASI